MATTETISSGDGTTTQFSFTFPYIKTEDVKVDLQEFDTATATVVSSVQISLFSIPANNPTVIQFAALGAATNYQAITGAPLTNHAVNTSNIIRVRIYRFTSTDANSSTFIQGSAVRSQDLNGNFEQILYILQERENTLQTIQLGGSGANIIGTVSIQDDAVTADKLRDSTVTDSDRAVTTNHIRNDAVTTAKINDLAVTTAKLDDSSVTSAKIADGTIVNADVNASAAIAGTKVSPDFGSQNITTTGNVSGNNITATGDISGDNVTATGNATVTNNLTVNGTGDQSLAGTLKFDSGYGSVATAYGVRAWVNFNGTGTVAIRASGNVSSITDNGTGDYTVNFTNALSDSNFSFVGSTEADAANNGTNTLVLAFGYSPSTSSVRVWSASTDSLVLTDKTYISVAIFR